MNDDHLLPFWSWAYADLMSNDIRGVFAEWLVGSALDVDLTQRRVAWDNYDLTTRSGVTVEVKCGAYLQSWTQQQPSQVRYAGLTGREWLRDISGGAYAETRSVRADVFVFSLQTCVDRERYDAGDTSQWEFRLAAGADVTSWNQRSVSLASLRTRGLDAVTYDALPAAFERVAATLPVGTDE